MANNPDPGNSPENADNASPFSYGSEVLQRIPLLGEKFTLSKKTREGQVRLEKRWATSTKKIEIPVRYEELYIDGKKIDSRVERDAVKAFSTIKDKIKHAFIRFSDEKESEEGGGPSNDGLKVKHYDADIGPLNEGSDGVDGKTMPAGAEKKKVRTENVVTIWGEEIIVNKRMVKLGEYVVKKYEVTQTKNVDVELTTEKLTIHPPNSHKEEIV